jgi:hypothetical protein
LLLGAQQKPTLDVDGYVDDPQLGGGPVAPRAFDEDGYVEEEASVVNGKLTRPVLDAGGYVEDLGAPSARPARPILDINGDVNDVASDGERQQLQQLQHQPQLLRQGDAGDTENRNSGAEAVTQFGSEPPVLESHSQATQIELIVPGRWDTSVGCDVSDAGDDANSTRL